MVTKEKKPKNGESKRKALFVKKKYTKKSAVYVVLNVEKLENNMSLEKKECSSKSPILETKSDSHSSNLEDETAIRYIMSNWKEIKREKQREVGAHALPPKVLLDRKVNNREKQREEARFKLDQIKNTTHFNDNIEAMSDFQILIASSS
ncbi:unnamed protein product [Lupinus luteus]|uniref:Uncharacterized protein n=1 Tax=Lupinus luteus TaxID=3873 RepID=A0AAV1WZD0_LUPLU